MSTGERIWNVILAVAGIACACAILRDPVAWYPLVIIFLSAQFVAEGLSRIWFYGTMARHMVGGKSVLYRGIFYLDFGLFAASLTMASSFYVRLYLAATHLFAGVVDVLRALEKGFNRAPSWKGNVFMGIVHIAIAVACLFYIKDLAAVMYICAFGFFVDAINRLFLAFRSSDIISIQ